MAGNAPSAGSEQRDRLLAALRNHGLAYGELGRRLGVATGLHQSDAKALTEILEAEDRGAALTQSELSQRIGLTAGATSSLLNRLEEAGHIVRVRDSADRRLVTLRATPGVDALVNDFFGPLAERMGRMMDGYPPELLDEFTRFVDEVCTTMNGYLKDVSAQRPQ
ncbi:MarR family winged helix-turn-helix transcriptional regulator [Paractinoplanes lichenicola]|uniref:MarR family transcriptional regulator n=1 Tax=Paractinoplanes lichenicola TaxID=2802976 RepID=A0ABS1VWE6_9ACTN|nr:MarR family transcriptional regulator [Actinoplanes lichenicola]MBL7258794.1 MarR family transcriptional regulator [Actinoplanes lichenicola]